MHMRVGPSNHLMLYLLNHGLSVEIYPVFLRWSNELNSGRISMEMSAWEDNDVSHKFSKVMTYPKFCNKNKEARKYDSSCMQNILSYNWTSSRKWIFGLAQQPLLKILNINQQSPLYFILWQNTLHHPQKYIIHHNTKINIRSNNTVYSIPKLITKRT